MFEPLLGHGKAIAVEMFPQPWRSGDSRETTTNQSGRLEVVERKENEDPMDELCWQIFEAHGVNQFIFVFFFKRFLTGLAVGFAYLVCILTVLASASADYCGR